MCDDEGIVIAAFVSAFAQAQTDPLIEVARKAAAVYAKSLPDYVVKRSTTRYYIAGPRVGSRIDSITGDVMVQQGKEVYANIRVNGKPAESLPPRGTWAAGEFANEIPMLFSPHRAAVFSRPHPESIRDHAAVRYDFAIDREHSTWTMAAAHTGYGQSTVDYSPAYTGKVGIEDQAGQTLAIEMSAHRLPRGFPVTTVDLHTDYDYEKIGNTKYLLPVHSQTTTCGSGGNVCYRNETRFRDFEKFESNSDITFNQPSN